MYCEKILQVDDDDDSAEPQFKREGNSARIAPLRDYNLVHQAHNFNSPGRRRITIVAGKLVRYLDNLLLDELVELCLDIEAYEEVDDLVQECYRFPHKITTRDSPDEDYRNWYQFDLSFGCQIQPRLASFKAPTAHSYWEDSRTYMRSWQNVTMTAARPKPPACGRAMPARILVTEEGLVVKLPEGAFSLRQRLPRWNGFDVSRLARYGDS